VTAAELDRGRMRELPEQIADDLRAMIVSGTFKEGDSLGHEADIINRYGVSRPSAREALRILEVEGLVSIVRGVGGGIVVHTPNERHTARTAAMVLQARGVSLADVMHARSLVEPIAARRLASRAHRLSAAKELRTLIALEEAAVWDPELFHTRNAAFHVRLVALGGNQTLAIVAEMLNQVVSRAVADDQHPAAAIGSIEARQRGNRSQRRLVDLIAAGDGLAAEQHWHKHMQVVGRVLLGDRAEARIDLQRHI
jgi:DNA-binding FadR family transcriptional regulator